MMWDNLITFWTTLGIVFGFIVMILAVCFMYEVDETENGGVFMTVCVCALIIIVILALAPLPFIGAAWIFNHATAWILENIPFVIFLVGVGAVCIFKFKSLGKNTRDALKSA
jgi:hypothetical protein